ncbi:MAG: hypothetical protein M1830_010039 [Pleopsidium flavum]|nr:MAG: hypothetical protein M1830_010039 [Pleopsidium flavum]
MTELSAFQIGQSVELQDGRLATVQYVGTTHFAAGDWIGVDLEEATGKNDGAVQGERYFDCEQGHGMFVRPAVAHVIDQPTPKANGKATGKANGAATKARPQNAVVGGLRRQSVLDTGLSKRQSMNGGSPTPKAKGVAASRLSRSPTKMPTKHLGSTTSSGNSTPSIGTTSSATVRKPSVAATRGRPSIANRTSMGLASAPTKTSRTSRQSLVAPVNGSRGGATVTAPPTRRVPSDRPSIRPSATIRMSSTSGGSQASEGSAQDPIVEDQEDDILSPPGSSVPEEMSRQSLSPVLSRSSAASGTVHSHKPASSRSRASPTITQRAPSSSTVASREVDDLKTKLRLVEKKRMVDREKLKSLERLQGERDKFEGIIQKLQTKYQPQQQEIVELKKQLKEAETRVEQVETEQTEHETITEMATLDREMAEETAEVLKTELDALKQKVEELELEVDVLREENQELGQEMSPEEKTSQGWLQMERNNERLREALMRLRDMTQQQEAELNEQVKELEKDVQELGGVKEQYETTKEKLLQSEASVENLRQQLETALGAEEMIEELTEKNLALNDQMDEMRATIEDLESLKELNDELEVNHMETEKQMQEEIDYKETIITEQYRKATEQDETIEDLEYTLSRFRDLVTNLQSDLEDMRASQQITESEANELTSRSRAMMDLNMKLQVSASKTQAKTIDLELRKLEAQESLEHLAIVQLFLPEAFSTERDPVLALLRFRRVGFKADLLHGFVKERFTNQATPGHEENMFMACEVLDKLTWVSAMCDRFVNFISGCSVEEFAKFEGALYDLEPVERALNGWIEGLKRDELKEKQCAAELQRTFSLMSHLAEIHISQNLQSYADDIHMRAILTQSHLESTAAAMLHIKAMVQKKLPATDEDEEAQYFFQKTDAMISHSRSAKVITSKIARALEELKARSLSMQLDTVSFFEQTEDDARQVAQYTQRIGEELFALLQEEGRTEPFTYHEIQSTISHTTSAMFNAGETDLFSTFTTKLRSLTNHLVDLASLTSDLSQTVEFERRASPWSIRAKELKSSTNISPDMDEEIRRLHDSIHERATQLAIRDKTLEESSVKIELLESRMRDASRKNDRIAELERGIEAGKRREKDLAEAIEGQVREFQAAETDREKWKKLANEKTTIGTTKSGTGTRNGVETTMVASAREMENLKKEIQILQATIRYLREDNRRARLLETSRYLAWLHKPLLTTRMSAQERARLLRAEGRDVLRELLKLVAAAKVIDLNTVPKDKLKWRPKASMPASSVGRQGAGYEEWVAWRNGVVRKGVSLREIKERKMRKDGASMAKPMAGSDVAAKVRVRLPGKVGGKEVTIVNPGEFEEFRGALGFV